MEIHKLIDLNFTDLAMFLFIFNAMKMFHCDLTTADKTTIEYIVKFKSP